MVLLHINPKTKLNLSINSYGDVYINNTQHIGELSIISNKTGPMGPTGPSMQGLKGYKGPIGDIGPTGPVGVSITGPNGDIGDNGPKGCMGRIGQRGIQGPEGMCGLIGSKGMALYTLPRYFLYAKIEQEFQYADQTDHYMLLPWYHIANNGFQIQNSIIKFPNRFGLYKIECGLQVTNFSNIDCPHNSNLLVNNSLQIELCFTKQRFCKSSTFIIPYCQKHKTSISYCETLHHIYTVTEETEMEICLKTCGNIQDIQDTMYLSIMEIF